MTITGRQWLYRIEVRLASQFAERLFVEGRSPYVREILYSWRTVHSLRTGVVINSEKLLEYSKTKETL